MDENKPFVKEDSVDVQKILVRVIANWYWFIISFTVCIVSAFFVNRYTTPIYKVSASIIVRDEDRNRSFSGMESAMGMDLLQNKKNIQNEIGILLSYNLAHRTIKLLDFDINYIKIGRSGIKETNVYDACPFAVMLDTTKTNYPGIPVEIDILNCEEYILNIENPVNITKKMKFGQPFNHNDFNFILFLKDSTISDFKGQFLKYYFSINNLNSLVNHYKNKINIMVNDVKKGSILTLTTNGTNIKQEVVYLNNLCDEYIKYGLNEKNLTATNTLIFIDNQLDELKDSLSIAEITLQNFRLNNRLVNLNEEGMLIIQRYDDYMKEKVALILQQRYYNYLREYIDNKKNFKDIVAPSLMGVNDPVLIRLVEKLSAVYNEKINWGNSEIIQSPPSTILNANIDEYKKELIENLQNNLKTSGIAIADVNLRLSKIDSDIAQLPITERHLVNFKRKFQVNDEIYTYLLKKRIETAIAKASNVPDNKVLDYAREDNAALIEPKRSLNYLIAFVTAVLFPLMLFVLMELFNDKIVDRRDVEKHTLIPIIGSVSHNHYDEVIPVQVKPKSGIAESIRSLRTNLQYVIRDKKQKTILITSMMSGEGKTFCSINLAAIYAMSGKKTLLMGVDLRKPKVQRLFNLDETKGLSTYLIGQHSFDEIIYPSKVPNMYLCGSGPVPPNPAELIDTEKMLEFIDQAKQQFEIIIMDTPPVALVSDALNLAKYVDLVLFVVRQNYSRKVAFNIIETIRTSHDIKNLGIIINDVNFKTYYGYGVYSYGNRYGGYGYEYGYGNGQGYYTEDFIVENWWKKIRRKYFYN
jgi:tyrosine-protein kinase Etk/Wzc